MPPHQTSPGAGDPGLPALDARIQTLIGALAEETARRERAQASQTQTEAYLDSALTLLPGGMKILNEDFECLLVNSQYAELYDYPEGLVGEGKSSKEEWRFQAQRGDFGKGGSHDFIELLIDTFSRGETTSYERRIPNGRTVRVTLLPTTSGYISTVTDISESAKARREIRDLAKFPAENPNPILRVSPDGELLYANEAALAVEHLLTRHSRLHQVLARVVRKAHDSGAIKEQELRSMDRIYSLSVTPIKGEDYVNIYGRDITEATRAAREREEARAAAESAQLALKESETRFQQAVELAKLGHWAWDEVADVCSYCSDELARMYGVTAEAYIESMGSDSEADTLSVHPDDRERYRQVTRRSIHGTSTPYSIEYRFIRADGEVRYAIELGHPVFGPNATVVGSRGTIQDKGLST